MKIPLIENPRILHLEKPDDHTIEFSTQQIDELYNKSQAAIPFDSGSEWKDWLKAKVLAGTLDQVTLAFDGKPIGLITYSVNESKIRELLIFSAFIEPQKFDFIPALTMFAKILAKQKGCEFIRFHTARKGLIKRAIQMGFHVSEIVCRIAV